ncbi:hypothetical protein V8F20_008785 [Naviculisporaceae sp. PSN 640]
MCNHIFKRFPCGTTVLHRLDMRSCPRFPFKTDEGHAGPCNKNTPKAESHFTQTFIAATPADSKIFPGINDDSADDQPILCHAPICRKCNLDWLSYNRELSARRRQKKYGPDHLTDWYGYGDPDVDPDFPQYREWLATLQRIEVKEEWDTAEDEGEDAWGILQSHNENWRGGECGWKNSKGEPIEKVNRLFQWAAKERLRAAEMLRKRAERDEARRVRKEKAMELERIRMEGMDEMEGVEKTGTPLCIRAMEQDGGQGYMVAEDIDSVDTEISLASLSL